ncbi:hypothetical protein E4U11_006923, partial [Claviceps purpurea]
TRGPSAPERSGGPLGDLLVVKDSLISQQSPNSYHCPVPAMKPFSQKLLTHLRTFSLYYRQSLPSHISNSSLPMRLRLTDKMRSKAEPKAASSTGAINLNFEAEYTSRVQHRAPRAENTPTARG